MSNARRELAAQDRREVHAHPVLSSSGVVAGQSVVFCRDGKLDSLARNAQDPVIDRRVAVSRVGQCMDVGVATDVARNGRLVTELQIDARPLAGRYGELRALNSIFKTARRE